jgi:beta-methylarginine biosynthesis bifunctional aminotransferase
MRTPGANGVTAQLSALQRRLQIAAARPGEPWLVLTENVPHWPSGYRPSPAPGCADPYQYPHSQGSPALVEAIVGRERELHGKDAVSARNVLVTNGAMHAMTLMIEDAARRGYRHAVCLAPVFHSVHELLVAGGLRVSLVPVGPAGSVDLDLLMALSARPNTLLYLNLPHNPTGIVLSAEFERAVRLLAAKPELLIVYDAVYDSFVFDRAARPTPVALAAASPALVVVNSLSKNYGRPGERIGWIVAHPDVVSRLVVDLERQVVAVNAAAQLTAAQVLADGNDILVSAVAAGRTAYWSAAAMLMPAAASPPSAGGTQVWLDLGIGDVEAFADYALEEHHIVLTTSSNYFPAVPGHIRYPTGLWPGILRQGVSALAAARTGWNTRPRRPARRFPPAEGKRQCISSVSLPSSTVRSSASRMR